VEANGPSYEPSIAGDGRYLAFVSKATNLIAGDENGYADVFIKDQNTGNVILASRASDGTQANGPARGPLAISGDGRFIAFTSIADTLTIGDTNQAADVFVYHRVLVKTEKVPSPSAHDGRPALSHTGRYVLFTAGSDSDAGIYLYDRREGETQTLLTWDSSASLSADLDASGRVFAYSVLITQPGPVLVGRTANPAAASRVTDYVNGPFTLSANGETLAYELASEYANEVYVQDIQPYTATYRLAGRVTDPLGVPLALVTLTDNLGSSTRTDAGGYFWLNGYTPGEYTLTVEKEGYGFESAEVSVQLSEDVTDLQFIAFPEEALAEAVLDIGMPYSFDRGCDNPWQGCGGRFHGFTAGYCTDLILDAYSWGMDYDIQFELERDVHANPAHFYRWHNARNTHDMWRYFSYSGQMYRHWEPYLPGDIIFFDWSGDGEIDHVALVSEVTEDNRPERLLDATGVINSNPSGLVADLPWETFHEGTVRGHARWSGMYEPYAAPPTADRRVLQIALGSPHISLRLVDDAGGALSLTERSLPGGEFIDLSWEEIVGVVDPLANGGHYTIELVSYSDALAPYQLTIQAVQGSQVAGRVLANGVLSPGGTRRIPLIISLDEDGTLAVRAIIAGREAKIEGKLRK
ncbi:MAG: DUF1287 domain-containing protein, partial [Gammaproteobacteria bacterium]|nr:DUF1287 domain-containing protein [Gammaproteobacteria bacterium]